MAARSIKPLKLYNGVHYDTLACRIPAAHSGTLMSLLLNIAMAAEQIEDTGCPSPDNMTIKFRNGVMEYWNTGHIIFNLRTGGTYDIPYMQSGEMLYNNDLHKLEHAYRIILTELGD